MGVRGPDSRQWRLIATIETHASIADVHRLLTRASLDVHLERVAGAPPTFRWFNVLIDAGEGDDSYARSACALLRMLNRSVDVGSIADFRVIEGNQWLTQRHDGAVEETRH
jgi:hypothetical protein